jgi:tetratricopeptide (TPR) repeat protein
MRARRVKTNLMHSVLAVLSAACLMPAHLAARESIGFHPRPPLENPCFVEFFNNEFDRAIPCFERELESNPNDPQAYNHLAQAILYNELFIHGALETELVSSTNPFLQMPKMRVAPAISARFRSLIDKSLQISQAELKRNPKDIKALYAFGVAHGLRANYEFLIDKDWMGALRDAATDRKANQQILDIDPNFVDARLITGLYKYVVGSLPFYLRALGFVGGFHLGQGSKEEGIREIQQVSRNGILDRYDADVLLAAIFRREHRPQDAIPLLKELSTRFPRNYLFRFEEVEMYSDMGDKKAALRVIDTIEALQREGEPGYAQISPAKIAFLRANLLFWYGDLPQALENLKKATSSTNHLDLGTRTMAWLRLGQVYDLERDHPQAVAAYREVMKTAPDSQAAVEAKNYISIPYRRKPGS